MEEEVDEVMEEDEVDEVTELMVYYVMVYVMPDVMVYEMYLLGSMVYYVMVYVMPDVMVYVTHQPVHWCFLHHLRVPNR